MLHVFLRILCMSPQVSRVVRTKHGMEAVKTGKSLGYSTVKDLFPKAMMAVTDEPGKYGLHSLRSGGALAAAAANVADRLISSHGRWKCEASRNRFIKDSDKNELKICKPLVF